MSENNGGGANTERYNEIISEVRTNRDGLENMLATAVEFRKQVNALLPATTDFKKRYLVEERMKLVTAVFGIELDIRRQRESSLKTELELIRKVSGEEDSKASSLLYADAVELAKAIEKMEGKKTAAFSEEVAADGADDFVENKPK